MESKTDLMIELDGTIDRASFVSALLSRATNDDMKLGPGELTGMTSIFDELISGLRKAVNYIDDNLEDESPFDSLKVVSKEG